MKYILIFVVLLAAIMAGCIILDHTKTPILTNESLDETPTPYTSGNQTVWYDAGTGNTTTRIDVKATTRIKFEVTDDMREQYCKANGYERLSHSETYLTKDGQPTIFYLVHYDPISKCEISTNSSTTYDKYEVHQWLKDTGIINEGETIIVTKEIAEATCTQYDMAILKSYSNNSVTCLKKTVKSLDITERDQEVLRWYFRQHI